MSTTAFTSPPAETHVSHARHAHRTSRVPPPRRGPTLTSHRLPRLPGQVALPEQKSAVPSPVRLDGFNSAPAGEVTRALLGCCRSLRWVHRLADHRPYPDLGALLAAADEAAYDLTPADLAEALAGESLTPLPDGAYSAAHTALSAAHAAYESRFGHVFVICLDAFSPGEALDQVLVGIRSRLTNDPEEERVVTADELRRLARGRLTRLVRQFAHEPRHADNRRPE